MNTFTLNLDLDKRFENDYVRIRQGDQNGTTIVANIYDHGTALDGTGLTARIRMRLPDGEHFYEKDATLSGNVATVTIDETQAASVSGTTDNAYFQILSGSTVIASTQDFTVRVLRDATSDAEVGENYSTQIQQAIDSLNDMTSTIPEKVVDEVDAQLAAHPEWTTTVEDNSLTDAKLVQKGGVIDAITRLDNLLFGVNDNHPAIELFEHGSIHNGQNDTWRSGVRARSKDVMRYSSPTLIAVTSGSYFMTYYDDNDDFTSQGSWNNSSANPTYVPANQGFRLVITSDLSAGADRVDPLEDILAICQLYVDNVNTYVKNICDIKFEHGSLNQGMDDTFMAGSRMRSVGITSLPMTVDVHMENGGWYGIHLFDDDDSWISTVGWNQAQRYRLPAKQKFRLVLSNDLSSAGITDISSVVDNLVIEAAASRMPVASPNIVFQCRNVDDLLIPPESKWYVQAAVANQYDRVRFTVRKTTDDYYFNCHDDTINNVARNMDGSVISDPVSADGQTLATLNSYDWGIKYGQRYAGATVPLLEDTLKLAAMFNLGVTWHAASALVQTDADIEAQLSMLDRYGLTDNLIVITSTGNDIAVMRKFINHNPRISAYVLANDAFYTQENIDSIKTLQTPYNKIYIQAAPWGTLTPDWFMDMAKTNNFLLYNSIVMSESDLLNEDTFSHGYSLIEANNVYSIKDTINSWANSQI